MTMLELLVSLGPDFDLSQDGTDIFVRVLGERDMTLQEMAAVRRHKQALVRHLPRIPRDAPAKIHGPGGNVVRLESDSTT